MITDPIANMLVMIKNAGRAKKENVDIPASNMAKIIIDIFKRKGFVKNYKEIKDDKQGILRIYLKIADKASSAGIKDIKRISTPGRRKYVSKDKIPSVLGGLGIAIISTSQGVLTDEEARKKQVGGEVICYVW
ncbi:MAG: 30S ribosomal protein S8 [Candidatus Omnitrophota bacterium]